MSFLSKLKLTASSIAFITATMLPNIVEAYNTYITPNIYLTDDNKLVVEGNVKKSSSNFNFIILQVYFSITLLIFASSFIKLTLFCKRPAVSTMIKS